MRSVPVLIASYLEPEHVRRIAAVEGVQVLYEPGLLPQPRYIADHHGAPLRRTAEDEARWRSLLAQAEVLFDFDFTNLERIPSLAPRVKWIQATSAGIGETLRQTGLIDAPITYTTASGIHGVALAEFVVMAMLMFAKEAPRMARDQAAHRWERYCGRELRGRTVGIVGLGSIGREVARTCKALGLRVLGTKRTAAPGAIEGVDRFLPLSELGALVRDVDVLVLACPQTPETEGLIGARELRSMRRGAILINIARGVVVDEGAMLEALQDGHLGGAALDVVSEEPPPAASSVWDLPNVILCPHSASTVEQENERLTDLFCENLGRYLRGAPLRNVFDRARLY